MNKTNNKHGVGGDHFSAQARRALLRARIRITGLQGLPDADGSFANGETGYLVDDNGTGRVLSYRQIVTSVR